MIYFDEDDVEGLGQAFLEALSRRNGKSPMFRVGGSCGRRLGKAHPVIHVSDMADEIGYVDENDCRYRTVISSGCGGGCGNQGSLVTDGCGFKVRRSVVDSCGGRGIGTPSYGCGGVRSHGCGAFGGCGGMIRRGC